MAEIVSKELMTELEKEMQSIFGKNTFSFEECLSLLLDGELSTFFSYIGESMKQLLSAEFTQLKQVVLVLLLVGILGSVFSVLSEAFENKQVSKMSQTVFFLLTATLLLGTYQSGSELCESFVVTQKEYMTFLLPTFCMVLSFSTGMATGYSYYQLTLFLLLGLQMLLQYVFFPVLRLYMSFALLNGIGGQKRFEKAQNLCGKVIEWGTRCGVYVGVGSLFLQGMLYPKIDESKRTVLKKGIGLIPGVGELSDSATQIVIASAELLRNCLGITGAVGLLVLVAVPFLKLFCMGIGMKFCASFLEIIGEKKISNLSAAVGNVQLYFVRILLCEVVLFLLSFAVIALCTNTT